jgi:hypothetical protein
VQPNAVAVRLQRIDRAPVAEDHRPMAKLNHQKRHRPRPVASRRRRSVQQRVEEQRSRREIERWRKSH